MKQVLSRVLMVVVLAKKSSKKIVLFVKSKDIFVRTVVTVKEKKNKATSLRMLMRTLLSLI
jgi:hypothetical protein